MANIKYFQVPMSLYRRKDISPSAILLYSRLDLYQGKQKRKECVYAKTKTLAKERGWSSEWVRNLLKELEEKKLGRILPNNR